MGGRSNFQQYAFSKELLFVLTDILARNSVLDLLQILMKLGLSPEVERSSEEE